MTELTQEIVRELLDYATESGCLTWKTRGRKWFKTNNSCASWNGNYAGKEAGCKHSVGYIMIRVFDKPYSAHRLVWLYVYGYFPKEMDHINHDRTDNRIINLREVTRLQNTRNKRLLKTNTSGVTGVYRIKDKDRYRVSIGVNGKSIHISCHEDIGGAIAARKAAEIEYGFHPNHGMT